MNHLLVALPLAAVAAAASWPAPRPAAVAPVEPGVCEQMTPARMLQNPGLASAYGRALRSGDPGAVERLRAHLEQLRTAHGCTGEVALPNAPEAAPALPPGHPPIAPRLPPGHPPIEPGERPPLTPHIEAPGIVTI